MPEFPVLLPKLQIGFYERLQQAKQELLLPALLDQVGNLDIAVLDQQLSQFAGQEKLSFTASNSHPIQILQFDRFSETVRLVTASPLRLRAGQTSLTSITAWEKLRRVIKRQEQRASRSSGP
jgi:hypothetical protein